MTDLGYYDQFVKVITLTATPRECRMHYAGWLEVEPGKMRHVFHAKFPVCTGNILDFKNNNLHVDKAFPKHDKNGALIDIEVWTFNY